jgi:hypothetical protein
MPDYKKGKIYMIWSPSTDKVYIGSTTQTLCRRFQEHRSQNCSSQDILALGDARIELVEEYPCNNRMELNRREGEIIRERNCVNIVMPGRTKEMKQEYDKEYYKDNKELILDRVNTYYQEHKEAKQEYALTYRQQHIEDIRAYDRERARLKRQDPEYKKWYSNYMKEYRQRKKEITSLADHHSDTSLHRSLDSEGT